MINDLYSGAILDAAAAIPAARRLSAPDASATRVSRVCGSEITVDLKLSNGRVSDFAITAKACALGQAAASIVAGNIVGATPASLYQLRDEMRAMLKENGPPPTGARWRDLALLEPVRNFPPRHASTMLVFDAVAECLDQISKNAGIAPV